MKIAFDAMPLLGRMTGIGYCEAGQVSAMTRLHPEHDFTLNYFALRHGKQRLAELSPYLRERNVGAKRARMLPLAYRAASAVLPVPYQWFFGANDLTHFFNYIVPPNVGGKTVVTVHDMVYRAYPETVRGRTKNMLDLGLESSMERADRIVTDSEFSRSEIVKYYPQFAEKLRVVPCGVDMARFSPVTDSAQISRVREKYGIGETYFLYLGTLEPRKNLVNLVRAYGIYSQSIDQTPAQLVLAGGRGWLYDEIFAVVKELGLTERVIFTEYVDGDDLPALMTGSLGFAFPSIYEGFGMPPLEAMACGAPVLVSDAASLPEVTGDCAVIVKPDDLHDMANGLLRLHTEPALRAQLAAAGTERAKQFSWERSAQRLYAVYAELLGLPVPEESA